MFSTYLTTLRGFNRNVLLHLLAISLIGFSVDGGVYSVVYNLFLLRLGYGPDFVGQINSAGMIAFAICCLPAGAFGSRWGNRRAMIMGLSLMMVSNLLLSFVEALPPEMRTLWLFVTYISSNIGIAIYFVNTAPFLVASTSAEQRSHAFALQSAAISSLAFVGSLLGGFLPGVFASWLGTTLDNATPYRYPMLIAALLINVGIFALTRTTELPAAPLSPQPRRTYASYFRVPRLANVDWQSLSQGFVGLMIIFTLIRIFQMSGMAVTMTYFNVYMDAGLHAPTAQVGLLIGLGKLLAVPVVLSMPMLSARWGNQRLVVWSSLSAVLCLLPLALVPQWWAAGLGYMGIMAGSSIRYTSFMLFAMEMVKPEQRSILSGVSEMTAGLSFAVMALLGGYIIVNQGYSALFLLGALLSFIGTLLFWVYFRLGSKSQSRTLAVES